MVQSNTKLKDARESMASLRATLEGRLREGGQLIPLIRFSQCCCGIAAWLGSINF